MRPETLLEEWLQSVEFGDGQKPKLDDGRMVAITVGGAFSMGVTINPDTRVIGFLSFLLRAPEPRDGAIMHQILCMNLSLLALRNASLSIDPGSGMLVLARTVAMDTLDGQKFREFMAETAVLSEQIRDTVLEAMKVGSTVEAPVTNPFEGQEIWLRL